MHTATLLSTGTVLVAGGRGGSNLPTAACELYNPSTGTWKTTGSMATGRERFIAALLSNGRVLVTGGSGFSRPKWYSVATTEVYNPVTGSWTSTGSLKTGRSELSSALLPGGQVLVAGGYGISYLSSAEVYQP
jgi:hypothetical protein